METSTGDPEGEVIRRTDVGDLSARMGDVLAGFIGTQLQQPPMHSALRQGGVRLYELARQGLEVERPSREVTIERIELLAYSGDLLEISVKCSKGTYIRTLAEDIGRRLGCGATLVELRRTAIGPLRIEDAVSLEALEAEGPVPARKRLLPPDVLTECLPRLDLPEAIALALLQGKVTTQPAGAPTGECRAYDQNGSFLGVARVEGGALHAVRLMAVTLKPQAPDFP
jgi:tRNA pseudouridine55 synthase